MYFIRVCPSHLPRETIKNSIAQIEWLYAFAAIESIPNVTWLRRENLPS